MTLVKMCVVCGAKTVPFMKTQLGDAICSPKCYRAFQHIIEVLSQEDDDAINQCEENTYFPSPILRDSGDDF